MDMEKQKFLDKARKLCALQERSERDLKKKLREKGCPPEWVEEIVEQLHEEGAVDDERFAFIYARSSLENKGWGALRIRNGLKEKGISDELAERALDSLDETVQERAMIRILSRKWREALSKGKENPKEKSIAAAERKGHPLPRILELMEKVSSPDGLDRIEPGSGISGE